MDRAAFLDRLADLGGRTRAELLERLPRGEPDAYLYGAIREYVSRSGKGLRPALMLATCGAFGGRIEHALTSAAALELLHNAFLIHDDIEDVSEFRRGSPCLHTRIGVPLAINAGDAMQAMALRMLRRNVTTLDPRAASAILDEFDHLLAQSLEGQAIELGWIRDNDLAIGTADYLRMTLKKTCWYSFIHPCRIGALVAGQDARSLAAFDAFGFFLGAAFQIQDDVLNLTGAQAVYGKEIMGDLFEGKRTLMVARLMRLSGEADRRRIARFFGGPRSGRSEGEAAWVFGAMRDRGCVAYAQDAARSLVAAARDAFVTAFAGADGDDKAFIAHCMDFMIERDA